MPLIFIVFRLLSHAFAVLFRGFFGVILYSDYKFHLSMIYVISWLPSFRYFVRYFVPWLVFKCILHWLNISGVLVCSVLHFSYCACIILYDVTPCFTSFTLIINRCFVDYISFIQCPIAVYLGGNLLLDISKPVKKLFLFFSIILMPIKKCYFWGVSGKYFWWKQAEM